MGRDKPTPGWSKEEVVRDLRKKAGPSGTVRAQVFLSEDAGDDLPKAAHDLVQAARERAGARGAAVIGKVHRLAKSFSIEASADVLAAIAEEPDVKSILPSEIEDIYPKPM